MKAKKYYEKGGKTKGLTTAQRKKRYLEDLKRKQAAEQKEISGRNFTRIMSGNYGERDLDERLRIANAATERLAKNREESVYSPQRKKAAAKFDKNTRYDDLLGRATNPNKKYSRGGKLKAVPAKATGLSKLPKKVRNKMGYMAYGGKVKAKKK